MEPIDLGYQYWCTLHLLRCPNIVNFRVANGMKSNELKHIFAIKGNCRLWEKVWDTFFSSSSSYFFNKTNFKQYLLKVVYCSKHWASSVLSVLQNKKKAMSKVLQYIIFHVFWSICSIVHLWCIFFFKKLQLSIVAALLGLWQSFASKPFLFFSCKINLFFCIQRPKLL